MRALLLGAVGGWASPPSATASSVVSVLKGKEGERDVVTTASGECDVLQPDKHHF